MIERIFHSIGQGAFYSERHENFNIVYDCGNWRNTKLADKIVAQAFSEGETIDLLFISHFDYDHVNKISTLKKHAKIKKVIMPLLYDDEKTLLINLYRALNFNILTIVENPQDFFGDETQVITVIPSENNEGPIGENIEPIDVDSLRNSQIKSGTVLKKNHRCDWIFIPYNYYYQQRHQELIELLSKHGFNIRQLKSNVNYTVGITKYEQKQIKNIYNKVSGNINQNSMLLYSGVYQVNNNNKMVAFRFFRSNCCCKNFCNCHHLGMCETQRVSCIYTGDTNLNIVKISTIFKNFWKSVGTIQIPHHGDIKCFDQSILDKKNYCCPISVGEKNSYGHPSYKVIAKILRQRSCPILVTENTSSGFIEVIRC